MNAEEYKDLVGRIEAGKSVDADTYAEMVAYAKARKVKRPPEPKRLRTSNKGKVCSVEGCGKPAQSLGLCKGHHTAHWRLDPVNLERSRRAARKHAAKVRYMTLVGLIGAGFHPDTRGADYESLPDGVTPERVDSVVEAALKYDLDVHGLALDAIHGKSS